jgi:uncharacterized protein
MDLVTVIFGLLVGLLVGATGVGGGSIMTPLLILVLGVTPTTAIGTDLAYAAVTKTLGGFRHYRKGSVDTRLSGWLAVGSVPGALGGVYVLKLLQRAYGDEFDTIVLGIVAGALAVTGIATLGRSLLIDNASSRERHTAELHTGHKILAAVIGLVVGFVLGISSAGSGALIAVALIVVFRLTPRRVVGTDIFHAAILLWVASFAHLVSGNVDLLLALNLLLGSLPGVWIGSSLAFKARPEILRTALGIVLCTAASGMAIKAGVDVPAPVFVGIPLILIGIAWLVPRRRARLRERREARRAASAVQGAPV